MHLWMRGSQPVAELLRYASLGDMSCAKFAVTCEQWQAGIKLAFTKYSSASCGAQHSVVRYSERQICYEIREVEIPRFYK